MTESRRSENKTIIIIIVVVVLLLVLLILLTIIIQLGPVARSLVSANRWLRGIKG